MQPTLTRRCFTEFIGTFALVLSIGVAISRDVSPFYIRAIVLAIVISFYGYVSGGHFNPAVTLAFTINKKFSFKDLVPYWFSQILGANIAVLFLHNSVGHIGAKLANTIKTIESPLHGTVALNEPLLLEIIGSFLFVTLILNIVTSISIPPKLRGAGIGLSLILIPGLFGDKADLSLNPARTMGPALHCYNKEVIYYTKPDGTHGYKPSPPYLRDGMIIALMSLIGGALAGAVHSVVHKDNS